jgi:cell division initiation protein
MLLSPLEIQQKQFPNRFRGLDAKEVESFLQKVADQMSVYLKQMDELKRELEDMERQLGEHKEREQTLKNTLISAQKTVEQMKVNAQKESKLLVSEAEVKAERILNNAHNRLAQIHEDIAELKRQRTQFELKIRATIETYQKMLDMQKEEEAEAEDLESKLKFFTYECPSGRPRVSDLATYFSSAPQIQPPAVARWHILLIRARCAPLSPASGFPISRPRDDNS